MGAADYSDVTELPGDRATKEQLARMGHRYAVAARYGTDKDVLEAGCGPGLGLGYLARYCRRVVGGDCTWRLVHAASRHYGRRVRLAQFDAQALPFRCRSFDVVILFEAIYYLPRAEEFVAEAARVLRPGGVLLVCSANPAWSGFARSPLSVRYYDGPELVRLVVKHGFSPALYGCVPAQPGTLTARVVSVIRRLAVALDLMPRTMKGRELFKRVFYGRLAPVPAELDAGLYESVYPLVPLPVDRPSAEFKVLYLVAELQAG